MNKAAEIDEKLIRGIGRWDLTAIVINTVIGAGIFGLPSKVAAIAGSYSLIALIACSLIIALIVLCFAEVSSRFRTTGGAYIYAKKAFGSFVGFEIGWLFSLTRFTAFAANCNLLVNYLGFFYEPLSGGIWRVFFITLIVCVLTYINFAGVRETVKATNLLTIGKLTPLFLFIVVGVFYIEPANFDFSSTPEISVFANAILVLIYAFSGFESGVIPAGEMKDPKKNAPFSLLTAIAIIVAFYILIQIVSIGTLPELASSERPLADAAQNFVGWFGAMIIVVGAIISILGNLNVGLLATTRLLFAMAENNDLPAIFARVHEKQKTPHVVILFTGMVIYLFTVFTTFISALTISTITRLIVYAATCLSLPVFRRRNDTNEAGFLVPFGVVSAILSIVLCLWLLWNIKLEEILQVFVMALIGLIFYFAFRFFSNTQKN